MTPYPLRVRNNILPLSVGQSLPEAFEEWSFTDRTIDHEEASETCQLCEQESLRYHFQIKNELTGHQLWVGSQCILKFGLSVFEANQRLSPADAKKKLDRILEQMRLEACVRSLERVAQKEKHEILTKALAYYRLNKHLSPKFAFVVLWRLQVHKIDHCPSFFKISLKQSRFKRDLAEMETSRVHTIWPALTSSQREVAVCLGHKPPHSK